MLTTGFKTYATWALVLLVAAIVFGYTTGGDSVGPVSMGWKGAVGNHIGYAILLGGAAVLGAMAIMLVAFRDADSDAAASYLHRAEAPAGQRPTPPTFWPVVAAFGAGTMVVGLVANPVLFVVGIVLMAAAAIEWTMSAWADAATGDPEVNKALRDRVMGPIEIPILGFAVVGVLVLAISRIFISVSAEAAVWVAMGVSAVIFFTAVFLSFKPNISRNVVVGVVLVGGIALLAGGVIAGVAGEREFHHEEAEHSEEGEEGDDHGTEPESEAETEAEVAE